MIGEYLRGLRAQAGMSLKEIAIKTRVRSEYLEALEQERFDKIPAEIYIKGYIRSYLKAISVNPAEGLRIYNEQILKSREADLSMQEPEKKALLPIRQLLYTAIALIGVAVAVFLFYQRHVPPLSVKKIPLNGTMISKNIVNSDFKDAQHPDLPKSAVVKAPVPVIDTSMVVKHNLSLEVLETTWISITIDGKDKKAMTLMPGDTAQWTGDDNFSLKLGNAGGVRVTFDGKDFGAPGPRGSVLTVNFPQ
ncbi:XRE family transcriptional regulator [Candidatus Magnetobacterium bavaricum]|uniref:XRE family transcriptional regulator n=1 Tax=Candidatus Magnetobacterium bavaricum TaxID=29290 RepID=A0A0F3GWP5_9BACT|nr:XRE family transcriptional regulator [Candidatus Magnetobacterium bavaricum]